MTCENLSLEERQLISPQNLQLMVVRWLSFGALALIALLFSGCSDPVIVEEWDKLDVTIALKSTRVADTLNISKVGDERVLTSVCKPLAPGLSYSSCIVADVWELDYVESTLHVVTGFQSVPPGTYELIAWDKGSSQGCTYRLSLSECENVLGFVEFKVVPRVD